MSKKTKWIVLGVCVICLAIGFLAGWFAGRRVISEKNVSNSDIHSASFFTSRTEPGSDFIESGYDLPIDITRIPITSFSEELQKASETIKQRYQEVTALSSSTPGYLRTDYDSRATACTYIGLSILKSFNWDKEECGTFVSVLGTKEGKIKAVSLETDYIVNEIRIQFISNVYTEDYKEEVSVSTRTTEDVKYTESYYTTTQKKQCHIIETTAFESGYLGMDGYIVDDGVLHQLHVAFLEKDKEEASNLLHQWADII